ncbi:MAG: polymer-forming cytoskeletal protein, partial [Gemmatimonadetes bacterium]|nr:polymer-forming cytoskeletal protein [Gemmatimonadota bacterium]
MHAVRRLVTKLALLTPALVAPTLVATPRLVAAQDRPASTLWTAVNRYNASSTTRATGTYRLEAGARVSGDVAVLIGPVEIAGEITGTLVAINANVQLAPTAVIRGDLLILGGTLTRAEGARLVPDEGRWSDWGPKQMRERSERLSRSATSYTDLVHFSAGSYNRVEGLPIAVGPRLRRTTSWGRVDLDAFGVVRSAGPVEWDRGTLGHDATLAVRLGREAGLTLGLRAFDVIAPVEAWQVSDQENGLGTFVAHRDLRDYYGRPNPFVHTGVVDLTTLRLRIDTRERVKAPWLGGWYVQGELESGRGDLIGPPPPWPTIAIAPTPVTTRYQRAFIDARRRTRLSPGTELSVRLVAGGWIGGDALPMQRRLSIGGPGAVEGYDFRRVPTGEADVFTCGGVADDWYGRPAMCERMALAQVELRQPIGFDWEFAGDDWRIGVNDRPNWVLFADAGRGWNRSV